MSDVYAVPCAVGPICGAARVPGSKSITNRAMLLGALATGLTTITNALASDDTRYMAESLRRLGLTVRLTESESLIEVVGCAGQFPTRAADLYVGNAGTAARFLTAALATGHGSFRIDGAPRMRQRPIEPLVCALRSLGVDAYCELGTGCPPVVVRTVGLRGGSVDLEASASSQYLSALLMAAPLALSRVSVTRTGQTVSDPYIDMTLSMVRTWGGTIEASPDGRFHVPPLQTLRACCFTVEPDASAASYLLAAAAITRGTVRVDGLGSASLQGDTAFVTVLRDMGCTVRLDENAVEVTGPHTLVGVDVDMGSISDTAMTLAAIAPFAASPTTIRGISHARAKECDRIAATVTELRRIGVPVHEHPDGMTIEPTTPKGGVIRTYDDHRIAMSFAITGLRARGIRIEDPACVAKTFPGFFRELERLSGAAPDPSG